MDHLDARTALPHRGRRGRGGQGQLPGGPRLLLSYYQYYQYSTMEAGHDVLRSAARYPQGFHHSRDGILHDSSGYLEGSHGIEWTLVMGSIGLLSWNRLDSCHGIDWSLVMGSIRV